MPLCWSPREPQSESGACLSALRGPGHLHDRGAEKVLQRHEEAGLQEAAEAHPAAPGEPGSQFGVGEDLLGAQEAPTPQGQLQGPFTPAWGLLTAQGRRGILHV